MDLLAYWRVIERQRRIVVIGLAVAFALSLLVLFRVGADGVGFRSPPKYGASSVIFVTQSGFPWGRSTITEYVRARGTDAGAPVPQYADPSRMEYLAGLYSRLAQSDSVLRRIAPNGNLPDTDSFRVYPLSAPDGRPLPLIEVSTSSTSESRALALANSVTRSLRSYIEAQQTNAGVPESTRVELPVVKQATEAEVVQGIKLTTAFMIALLGTISTLFAAFTVDNVARQRALRSAGVMADEATSSPGAPIRHIETSRGEAASTRASSSSP